MPDADRASAAAMRGLESELAACGITLLCCAAQPEVEVFACVAYEKEIGIGWAEVRAHRKMKEAVFQPLLARFGDLRRAGAGRDCMIGEALKNLGRLYRRCPEVKELRDRIAKRLQD